MLPGDVQSGLTCACRDALDSPGLSQHPQTMNPGLCRLGGFVCQILPGPSLEWVLVPSVSKGQRGKYVPLQAQDALPSSMVCVSFSTPCSSLVAHPQCKGPSRVAPVGSSLSHSVWSSHVLGVGTLPGNSSAEQLPAALRSPHMDPPDTSLSLGKSFGKSHVQSTSPLLPASHTSCSHTRWLHPCTAACLSPGG